MNTAKSFLNRNNTELFCILTGDEGIIVQTQLQNIVKHFLKTYPGKDVDLKTMVSTVAEEED